MVAQGATAYTDLLFLDASRHLSRPAGKGDLVGAEYGVPPSQCKGGKDAVKCKLFPGLERARARDLARADL
eukprot:4260532-Prymnesium_polylepis.1